MYFGLYHAHSLSDSRVPYYGLRSLAGWCASFTWLRRFPPAGQDGHAVLLAQTLIWPPVSFDLLAQAPLPLDHLQQLAVTLGGCSRRDCAGCGAGGGAACARHGLSLCCQLGQVLELQLQVVLLELLQMELSLSLSQGLSLSTSQRGTAGRLRESVQLQSREREDVKERLKSHRYRLVVGPIEKPFAKNFL